MSPMLNVNVLNNTRMTSYDVCQFYAFLMLYLNIYYRFFPFFFFFMFREISYFIGALYLLQNMNNMNFIQDVIYNI